MKPLLYIVIVIIFTGLFSSCKKDKPVHKSFTDKELDFLSYSINQFIKFIDTNNITHELSQGHYLREFSQFGSLYGNTNDFHEKYEEEQADHGRKLPTPKHLASERTALDFRL